MKTPFTVISTETAPAAVGPYSQAVRLQDLIFCSGQIPLDPETGAIIGTSLAEQTRQALNNLREVLTAAGSGLDRVLKTTVFLTDMSRFAELNGVYAEFFTENPPARSAVQVGALPKGVLVEIEAIAYKSEKP